MGIIGVNVLPLLGVDALLIIDGRRDCIDMKINAVELHKGLNVKYVDIFSTFSGGSFGRPSQSRDRSLIWFRNIMIEFNLRDMEASEMLCQH